MKNLIVTSAIAAALPIIFFLMTLWDVGTPWPQRSSEIITGDIAVKTLVLFGLVAAVAYVAGLATED